ncbi:MAG TPA: 2-amino-4-hydroxy-6-hydroxymethyldihydropteridine diphosphokinase [Bacteroidota bacterium]|nr:2-amino-4-hydroxy-6-hydroxymethyldihydropteridine diphosphokinase [Bacteroidota bacterium]
MRYRVYLGLGSNIGPRLEHLTAAVANIGQVARVTAVSSVYETEPVGMEGADDFLNMAVGIETDDDPPLLLVKLRKIEKTMGRKPSSHHGPRIIDIDILLYRGMTYDDHMVRVPHPQLHRRRFALEPLNEIAPTALHPTMEKTVGWLLRNCRDSHRVLLAGSLPDAVHVTAD